ncbi:TRAP transporter substrate-binding protein [Marinivivus vitaminiproducens]|uniref:TRAP transporter substrate-binding protein n=1 Tax=Marinivivus vitaminiproducens TaxID=3035935 RepID=UPI00279F2AAC|nr:TRAP transporter substrate-binding protein [Geminicoccaceae bacterium SCSIO 64248]
MKWTASFFATALLATHLVAPPAARADTLDVASTFPKGMPYLGEGAEHLAELLDQVSEGELGLRVHGAGDLVPALEVFNAVSSGAIDAGWDWVGYWAGAIPVAGLAGAMPFGPSPEVFLGWMWDAGGLEILQKAYDPYDVKVLPCHLTVPEPAGWFQKEIKTVDDLKGLRFRISGLGGKVLNRLGASTQLIPGGEIYVALERGRIDGTEFSLPTVDKTLGFSDIAKYYYFPGWHQPASWNSLIINMDVWNGFSEAEQNLYLTACRANVMWSLAVAAEPQADTLRGFEEQGVTVLRLPDPVLDALRETSAEVLQEEAANDPIFKEALDSINAYMETVQPWYSLQALPVSASPKL